ncbi:DUF3892 domain-containing protein [Sorangium cellulosum]|uniref:DUF3892 domain-containing protein n=1 Tax=Sorangium cellulosum TaxID=56 RepID=UPI0009D64D1F|nr:DUF3892 domain-containing protein [Sorangium cellulosum]
MATYYVTKVRKQSVTNKDGSTHEHIIGVVTKIGIFYTNKEVVDSLDENNEWYTEVEKEPKAKINKKGYCPKSDCYHNPYLTTDPDHTTKNNLENLPRG